MEINIIIFVSLIVAIVGLGGFTAFLLIKRKKEAPDSRKEQPYSKEVEAAIQKTIEDSLGSAAHELKGELQETVDEISKQNQTLLEGLKQFEEGLIGSFKSLAQKLYDTLSQDLNSTISEIQARNKELVGSVNNLEGEIKDKFQNLLARSLKDLEGQLSGIAQGFNEEAKRMVHSALQQEITGFQQAVANARRDTIQSLSKIYKEIEENKKQMQDEAMRETEEYKKRLLENIDQRMNDIITGFLLDNLGESLDLDSQRDYIFAMLEEHKEELKKEIHG